MSAPDTTIVVGAGIVGLATAREILRRQPGASVTVVDKEDRVGAHQSSHNSGVVHAGLYYPVGSRKAVLCRRGGQLLREFAYAQGIVLLEHGKVVVAVTDDEVGPLREIERRAAANGVPDLGWLDPAQLAEVEPGISGVAAVHSPHTAVVDFGDVARALADDIRRREGSVLLGERVDAVRCEAGETQVRVVTDHGEHVARQAVVCAGLTGDRLAVGAGLPRMLVPFRGQYHRLSRTAALRVRGLVYPVPDPRYPFLGVHLTRGVHGHVEAGPNAVVGFAYEGCRRGAVRFGDLAEIARVPGLGRFAARHWRAGLREAASSLSLRRYAAEVARYLPGVTAADLGESWAGVRAQALLPDGAMADDFVLQRRGPVLWVRNAPSPAATASLAIAEVLADDLGVSSASGR